MLEIEGKLVWISTLGGPLILMQQDALNDWKGDLGYKEPPDSEFISDYDRACAVKEYVEILQVGDSVALVLGDLPSHTTYVQINPKIFLLIRWIGAENEDHVLGALRDFDLEQSWIDTGIVISFGSGDLILFDSVYAGNEMTEFLKIKTEPGDFRVSTLSYHPDETLDLFIIRLG